MDFFQLLFICSCYFPHHYFITCSTNFLSDLISSLPRHIQVLNTSRRTRQLMIYPQELTSHNKSLELHSEVTILQPNLLLTVHLLELLYSAWLSSIVSWLSSMYLCPISFNTHANFPSQHCTFVNALYHRKL